MRKVLVVDDEPAVRDLMIAVLEDEGYTVIAADSGRQALDLLTEERPDLVLLDIMMPGMDGREVYRRLRQLPGLEVTPVILVSAAAQPGAIDPRTTAFLPKPFELEEFLTTIDRILDGVPSR